MQKIALDSYVIDVLMPDLVGHDRRPAAFLVYLFLLRQAAHPPGPDFRQPADDRHPYRPGEIDRAGGAAAFTAPPAPQP